MAVACSGETPADGGGIKKCSGDADCASGQFCSEGLCAADTAPPTVTITAPQADARLGTAEVLVTGTASDGAGVGGLHGAATVNGAPAELVLADDGAFTVKVKPAAGKETAFQVAVHVADKFENGADAAVKFVGDLQAPVVRWSSLARTAYGLKDVGSAVTLVATCDDGDAAKLETSSDGGATWTAASAVHAASVSVAVEANNQGTETKLLARATDGVGNVSDPVAAQPIFVDTVAPVLAVTSPAEGELFNIASAATTLVKGTMTDATATEVVVKAGGTNFTRPVVNAAFEQTILLPASGDSAEQTVEVEATDRGGNSVTVARKFKVDRQAPTVSWNTPTKVQFSAADIGSSVNLVATAADAAIAKLEISSDDGATWVAAANPQTSTTTITVKANDPGTTTRLKARATDLAGNVSAVATSAAVYVDTVAPQLNITSPTQGQLFNAAAPATASVDGTVTESSTFMLTARYGGNTIYAQLTGNVFHADVPIRTSGDLAAETIEIAARDQVGNETIVQRTINIDRMPPVVQLTAPTADAACSFLVGCTGPVFNLATTKLTFSGSASDGAGLAGGVAVNNGASLGTAALQSGNWTFDWTSPPADNGKYYDFTFTATDASGNSANVKRKVYVDRVKPTYGASAKNSRTVGATSPIVTFSEAMKAPTVEAVIVLYERGTSVTKSLVTNDGITFTGASLISNDIFRALLAPVTGTTDATDMAGNALGMSVDFEFRTAPAEPPGVTQESGSLVKSNAGSPELRFDTDGNPMVLAADGSIIAGHLAYWDGRSSWIRQSFYPGDTSFCSTPVALTLYSDPLPDLTTNNTFHLVTCSGTGTGRVFRIQQAVQQSLGSGSGTLYPVGSMLSSRALSAIFYGETHTRRNSSFQVVGTDRYTHLSYVVDTDFGPYFTRRYYDYGTGTWNADTSVKVTGNPLAIGGVGALAGLAYFYGDNRETDIGASFGTNSPTAVATSLAPVQTDDLILGKTYPTTWQIWAESHLSGSVTVPSLRIACSTNPTNAGTWQLGGNVVPTAISNARITHLRVATTSTLVGFAVATDGNEMYFGTLPNSCTGAPGAPAWTGPFAGKTPSIAFRGGELWRAYEDLNKAVVVRK